MKLSIVRTDKKNISHLTVKPIEWFLERIKTDTKAEDIGKFRHYIARFGDTGQYEDNVPMAMIHPLVEMTKTENGNLEITTFNSLTWLHVSGLMKPDEIKAVKEASKILPTTFAWRQKWMPSVRLLMKWLWGLIVAYFQNRLNVRRLLQEAVSG